MYVRKFLHVAELAQLPLVVLPHDRALLRMANISEPAILPRKVYSTVQKDILSKAAIKLESFPFHLERAAKYYRHLVTGDDSMWAAAPLPALGLFRDGALPTSAIAVQAPVNIIEPHCVLKPIVAVPVNVNAAFKRKRAVGIGKMSAQQPIEAQRQQLGLPSVDDHGDLIIA